MESGRKQENTVCDRFLGGVETPWHRREIAYGTFVYVLESCSRNYNVRKNAPPFLAGYYM